MESYETASIIPVITLVTTGAFLFLLLPRFHPEIDTRSTAAKAELVITITICILAALAVFQDSAVNIILLPQVFSGFTAGKILMDCTRAFAQHRDRKQGRRPPSDRH